MSETDACKVVPIQCKRDKIQQRLDAELYRRIIARVDHLNLDGEKREVEKSPTNDQGQPVKPASNASQPQSSS